jgi:predicted MFS family arabinose efflux permease
VFLPIVVPFCAAYYVSYVLRTVNAVIAPELVGELGLGPGDLGFLTSTYFLAFAIAQLPVGVALDRFGARRVVALLMAVATAGVLIFATGRSFAALAVGRGLAGLGVSASLMGGFKAFGEAFPRARQAALTGVIMAAGACGALTTSVPLAWALPHLGWRGALAALAGMSAVAAALVFLVVPPSATGGDRNEPPAAQLRALLAILGSRSFWRYAPQAALFSGGFMALQGLWVAAWLITVDGHTRGQAATTLMILNLGLLAGQVAIVLGATRLNAAGLGREGLLRAGVALALVVEALIVARVLGGPVAWFALGLFNAAGAQLYGVASARFPAPLAGRVSAGINLLAFVGAFAIQWGLGIALEALGGTTRAMQIVFAALWVGQAAAAAWAALGSTKPAP